MNEKLPTTLLEATRYFADEDNCINFVSILRWENGIVLCPHCGSDKNGFLATRKIFKCKNKECRKQFSVKVGTIFEDSAVKLDKWLVAIWLIANAKNGISSYELGRSIGITQKSAWFMLHRIRLAMDQGSLDKLSGTVEADETWVGGDAKNMHTNTRLERGLYKHSKHHKTMVLGMLERKGKVIAKVVPDRNAETLHKVIGEAVKEGSNLMTDEFLGYKHMNKQFIHDAVNHSVEYVRGNIHTNGIENFWSLMKRTIKGTYISIEASHLQSYVEEQCFRYNNRETNDLGRFMELVKSVGGKRVTWDKLIGSGIYWRARKIQHRRGY